MNNPFSRSFSHYVSRYAKSVSVSAIAASVLMVAGSTLPSAQAQVSTSAGSTSSASSLSPRANLSPDAYILGPGDQVQLNMFGQETLFPSPYTVLVDGSISLPFIGSVLVSGKTISGAQQEIAQRYTKFFKRPFVTVVLLQPRPIKVNIAGEVRRPGPYPLSTAEETPTISSLITLAGGYTASADLSSVTVRRPQKDGSEAVLNANLIKLIQEGDGSQNLPLRDGDTVLISPVPITANSPFDAVGSTSLSPEASEPLNVAVVGEVFRPGPYIIAAVDSTISEAGETGQTTGTRGFSQPTLTQAIQRAGGIKPEANVRKIQVRRLARNGEEKVFSVDLWKLLQEGDLSQDVALQDRDTIIVNKATALSPSEQIALASSTLSPSTIDVNIVGEVNNPGPVQIRPNTPLSQAVLAAGGFRSGRANKKSVDLIRVEPDGSVTKRRIKLAFSGIINEETNPALRNNDVVVIRRSGFAAFGDGLDRIVGPFNFIRLLPGI